MPENTVSQLRDFVSTPENKCSTSEFMEFWKSLTDEQKADYKNADLD